MTSRPTNPDVIVVGAGTAGLSTAQALIAQGFSVCVLEAAGHVGGRCVTDTTTFKTPFDRGASWLHSAAINPLARLAEERGARLHKRDFEWRWVQDGPSKKDVAAYAAYQEKMWACLKAAGGGKADQPAAQALPEHPLRPIAQHWVAQMHAGDADLISSRDVASYEEAQGDWLVAGGLGAFVGSLFADIPVALNCAVREIDATGPKMQVRTDQGPLEADQVVVTVSTGLLAAETIRFNPPLPLETQNAISGLPMGLLNKVGFAFDPAWKGASEGDMADYLSGDMFTTILFGFYGTGLAVGFVAGRCADLLEQDGPLAATELCKEALRDIFGNDITKHIKRTDETAWRKDPSALGSYSYARPGQADARALLAQPVDNRLFFAGEATSPEAYATVHGAYLSGQRAAIQIGAVRAKA